MMVSFILCLLPALLATTSAQDPLTCHVCAGPSETCELAPGSCQDNQTTGGCLSVAEDNTLDGTKTLAFFKQCVSDYKSDIKDPITFTAGNGIYLRVNITQCNNADNCNSGATEVPKENATLNGLQCPTCFALNFTGCNNQITPCTGNEDHCIDFTGYLFKGSILSAFVVRGCGTASTQQIKVESTLVSVTYKYTFLWVSSVPAQKINTNSSTATSTTTPTTSKPTTATTRGGSPALGQFSFTLYLPGLTGLLLVKLLF